MPERFVKIPNLPQGRVTLAAVSAQAPMVLEQLQALGIRCFAVPPCVGLDRPVQSHADMVLHHLGGAEVLCYPQMEELCGMLKREEFTVVRTSVIPEKNYPRDTALNVLNFGDLLLGRLDCAAPELRERIVSQQIFVRQGYAKCACLPVDRRHVVTTDRGIAKALEQAGVQTLLIPPEEICLKGYPYGFIGGCGGKISANRLLLTGHFPRHETEQAVWDFAADCGVLLEILPNPKPLDIGSLLPLKEEVSPAG